MTMVRSEARTAKVVELFEARMRGMSQNAAALAVGLPKGSSHQYQCRTEDDIRADLARQLEGIVRRFEASL